MTYDDLQLLAFVPGSGGGSILTNANARSKGFEAEFAATPLHGLQLEGGVGFGNAEYRQFVSLVPGSVAPAKDCVARFAQIGATD